MNFENAFEKLQTENKKLESQIDGWSKAQEKLMLEMRDLENENKKLREIFQEGNKLDLCLKENKKLRECVEFYAEELNWRKQNQTAFTLAPEGDVYSMGAYKYAGERARQCLKEIEGGVNDNR